MHKTISILGKISETYYTDYFLRNRTKSHLSQIIMKYSFSIRNKPDQKRMFLLDHLQFYIKLLSVEPIGIPMDCNSLGMLEVIIPLVELI